MNRSKNILSTVANLRVDLNLGFREQIARRAYELWQERGSTSGNDWSDWFRAESEINEWHKRRTSKVDLAVPTNEPFLRCVGGPSMNDSLSTEVRSLTSFHSRELSLMNPVRLGSALRCGKTRVLARGTTQSSTWYNTCIDENPQSHGWLGKQRLEPEKTRI